MPYKKIEGLEHIDKVIDIDQSPIGRTPRSNPATYTKTFDEIRTLFAQTPEAAIRGYKPGRFSFNVKGGRCETCEGAGVRIIEMNFLPDVHVECETCQGMRFNRETLEVRFKGKSIADILNMTIEDATDFLKIFRKFIENSKQLRMLVWVISRLVNNLPHFLVEKRNVLNWHQNCQKKILEIHFTF